MNCTVSLFGDFGHGYTQYPLDSSKSILNTLAGRAKAKTQIAVHRDGELMYYCYIRRLDNSNEQYVGMCLLLNGVMLSSIKDLFLFYENVFSTFVVSGEILKFAEDGGVVPAIDNLSLKKQEIESIESYIRGVANRFDRKTMLLPPVNYGVSSNEIKILSEVDTEESIRDAINNYSSCLILKSSDYDNVALSSYKKTLQRVSGENRELKEKNLSLESEIRKVQRQKKQFKYVIIGCFALFIALLKVLDLNDSLDSAIKQNTDLSQENTDLSNQNTDLNNVVATLNENVADKDKEIKALLENLNNSNQSINCLRDYFQYDACFVPVKFYLNQINGNRDSIRQINGALTLSAGSSIMPKFEYFGISESEDTLDLNLYFLDFNSGYNLLYHNRLGIHFNRGLNLIQFKEWHPQNSDIWKVGRYHAELCRDTICLSAKNFTLE